MSYKIKKNPDDFIVNEVPVNFNFSSDGKFSLFKLKKKDYNTIKAIEIISSYLKCKPSHIGFAGNKDRYAITCQYISIKAELKKNIEKFKHEKISLEYVGNTNEQVRLGHLKGNEFIIKVKEAKLEQYFKNKKYFEKFNFINYFGEQRFSQNNKEIGKNIIKRDFKKAVYYLLDSNSMNEQIKTHMSNNKNDYIGALNLIPKKLLSLYINSYQSFMWNKCVSKILNSEKTINISGNNLSASINPDKLSFNKLEMLGFESDIENSPYRKILKQIMDEEEIIPRDFILKQFNNLSPTGVSRNIIVEANNLSIIHENDNSYKVSFYLNKGCYATVLLRFLFK
ncbi:MAG: tRNA pseudouridine(13) synthase TruD [Nanobdellota archaeon]